jgi:small subunit ribosomal protein S15Ae
MLFKRTELYRWATARQHHGNRAGGGCPSTLYRGDGSLAAPSVDTRPRQSLFLLLPFFLLPPFPGYIGEFEFVDNHRSGKIVVELNGRLNKCGVISPRYDIAAGEVEDWVGRLLPSRQFGYFIMTTSQGIMDHEEARRKKIGGKVLGFFY